MRSLVLVVAFAGVLAAGVAAGAPLRGSATLVCKPQSGYGEKVGTVLEVHGLVVQGAQRVRKGDALRRNAPLCTDGVGPTSGTVKFVVDKSKRTVCELRPSSKVRLFPKGPKPVLIRFEAGRAYCATGKDPSGKQRVYEGRNGWVLLYIKDPLFAVDATATRTVVKVALGYVGVATRRGGAVILGPGQQTAVPALGRPRPAVATRSTAVEVAAFARLRAVMPEPDLGRPRVAGSAVLARIFAGRSISAALIGPRASGAEAFWGRFLGLVARSWGLDRVRLRAGATARARESVDLVGTSEARRDALPLFRDPQGRDWYFAVPHDSAAREAFRRFLTSAVTAGEYGAVYRQTFGREPPLDVLRPVLFGAR